MSLRVRAAVAQLPSYVPGRPAPVAPGLTTYKLSSNENPFPPLPGVLAAVAESCLQMNRYPDMANTAVLEALSQRFGLPVDRFGLGTGSVAVLYHLIQTVCDPGDEVVHAWRSFEAYPIAVRVSGAVPVPVPLGPGAVHDLGAMRAAVTARTKIVLLCSPNNPTGPALRHDDVVEFLDSLPDDVLVVLDEAYVEFVDDPDVARGLELLDGRPNVALLRTFSKAYGLAGFRVGFCIAEPGLIAGVRAVSLPFGVSIPAQTAVIASLAAEAELLTRVADLQAARTGLAAGLAALGFDLPVAQGNFVWFPAGHQTADWTARFEAAGLVVRAYVADDGHDGLRVTVGEAEANARVLEVAASLPR
ncbi:MAG: histidinol-phosphate transaminase [Propionibacteriaceae bacterium]